ncbi:MAG: hypothetical protein H8F28_09985 [Fibrella sp.]|nr:hypothetical protein [Armatimonadota bacterium]
MKRSIPFGRAFLVPSAMFLTALCAVFYSPAPVHAAITAWLDYTDFDTRLSELAATATVSTYTVGEQTQIRTGILSDLQTIYDGFDVSFTETRPVTGDYERLVWGLSTNTTGLLGLADRIDLRNLHRNDTSRIYTANFIGIVNEFDGMDQRDTQLDQLSRALAGTAAHELAHNLGIEHCDCYAHSGIGPDNYANTNGLQNSQISATGGTALNEVGRETLRSFSPWERVKLAYAGGLVAEAPPVLAEQAHVHDSLDTTQNLSLTNLSVVKAASAMITGAITAVDEVDYYSFALLAGQTLTARVHSDTPGHISNPVNSFLSLLAPSGAVVFADDDIEYNRHVFNSGLRSDLYSLDTFFVNVPVMETGIYTLVVSGVGGDTGDYELLIATNPASQGAVVVPETSTGWLGCGGFVLGASVFWRRKRGDICRHVSFVA